MLHQHRNRHRTHSAWDGRQKRSLAHNVFCINITAKLSFSRPIDADVVMDVRFLPNPYYVKELKEKNGLDDDVYEYVMNSEKTAEFYKQYISMLRYVIPGYVAEGKTSLTIAIGCTGGQHRRSGDD